MVVTLVGTGEERWLKFLSRWSLLTGLVSAALIIAFFVIVLPASTTGSLSEEYIDLIAALQNVALYRVVITLDAGVWLALAGFFISLAVVLTHHAPIRSIFIAMCAAGMLLGLAGAFMCLQATTDLAARYAAASPEEQLLLLQLYDEAVRLYSSFFDAGALLWGMALVLAASVTWQMITFPRWLTILIALPGMIMLVQQAVGFVTGLQLDLFFPAFLLLIIAFFAMAWQLWRPRILESARTVASAPIH